MLGVDELLYKSGGVFSLVVTLLTLFGCLVSRWLGCSGGPSLIPVELVRGSLRLIGAIEQEIPAVWVPVLVPGYYYK